MIRDTSGNLTKPTFCPHSVQTIFVMNINPLNAELNPIRHLLALVAARHIVHVSRIRVNYFSKHQ